jgi:3D (Asp-Asp-Asp) domain-containing protein
MKNINHPTRVSLILISMLLAILTSCQEQPKKHLTLSGLKTGDTLFLGSYRMINGDASDEVAQVELVVDQQVVDSVIPYGGKFQIRYRPHREEDDLLLSFRGYNRKGAELAQVNFLVTTLPLDSGVAAEFLLPPLDESVVESELTLWATYYYLHQASHNPNGIPLRDMRGEELGPRLQIKDWCYAAMEGSVNIIEEDGQLITYNYAGSESSNPVNCSAYFSWNVSRSKFREAFGAYGDGVEDYKLVPFRTIAVDPSKIAYGSVVYIEAARGTSLTMPDGSEKVHDGYFFAGDTGGAIKGDHIDVYIGVAKQNPFSWIRSNRNGTFGAKVINDQQIIQLINRQHY